MSECRNHDAFCNAAGSGFGPFCSAPSDGSSVPPMRMYFHMGTYDIILFRGWVPVTGWQYALSCLAILAMGVVVQGMRVSWPNCLHLALSEQVVSDESHSLIMFLLADRMQTRLCL